MASSSNNIPPFKYDVFISFRGEDVRNNFLGHVLEKLREKGIKVYKDDADLERGDEISQALKKAIEMSKLYVIIFSKNYASSSWCLDELVHILACRQKYNLTVLPVFYRIKPSDVRHQEGSYRSAFATFEERFRNKTGKVQNWREALGEAANLAGWDSEVIRSESNLVEIIVKAILSKMNHTPSSDDLDGLVGITKRAAQVESLLRIGSLDIWKVGIWGLGGVGKTTLARVVFDRLSYQFENCCFLANVREEWGNGHEYDSKEKLFSELLREKHPNMGTLSMGSTYDKVRLRNKKVLIVLDDVNQSKQLEFLVENFKWFGPGSRIIVTTRDIQVLREEVDEIYEVERLNHEEALLLFHSTAFKRTPPRKDLLPLAERVINYSEGIPLALKVLGSFLRGQKQENWEEVLDKLKGCPRPEIQDVLRISYDGLDKKQSCIFLDIACFFKGMHRDFVERILHACGLSAKSGIDDLIDKSLITIKDKSILWMHDLVQEMGWEIEESMKLSERKRLWKPEDVCHVFQYNIGTMEIEGIVLDMSNINEVHFNPATFQNMYKLRLLKIFCSNKSKRCEVCIPLKGHVLQYLPNSLAYLHWEEYPWKSLPANFSPQHLVELNLSYSKVNNFWKGRQHLGSLKKIDLGYSRHLTILPDLSGASKLEHIYLENCTSLQEIPSYFQHLDELKTLFLDGCSSICKFPKVPKNIVCLVLSGTAIKRVSSSIRYLSCLEVLNLNHCRKLKSLPNYCIPLFMLETLKAVTLEGTPISPYDLPWWIKYLRVNSSLSLYQHNSSSYAGIGRGRCQIIVVPLRLFSKVESSPRLPLFGFYDCHDLYVEIVSISDARQAAIQTPVVGSKELLFYNCMQIYGIEASYKESSPSAQKLRFLSSKIALKEFTRGLAIKTDIGVCYQGTEIPKYFHYQHEGTKSDSLTVAIRLPLNSVLKPNLLGFAICVSCNFLNHSLPLNVKLICRPFLIMDNGGTFSWDICTFKWPDYLDGRAVGITGVGFKLTIAADHVTCDSLSGGGIIKCGVQPLYEEDLKIFGLLTQLDWKAIEEEEEDEDEDEEGKQEREGWWTEPYWNITEEDEEGKQEREGWWRELDWKVTDEDEEWLRRESEKISTGFYFTKMLSTKLKRLNETICSRLNFCSNSLGNLKL